MQFSEARPDVVRAINQRWLLKFWKRHKTPHRVPQWQAVEVDDLSRIAANLSILEVSGGDGTARFMIRFHGETIGQVYGSLDCRGKYLDEIIPAERHAEGLAPYHRALETGRPVYTIHDVTDRHGRIVHYERLLLPYARDGQNIDLNLGVVRIRLRRRRLRRPRPDEIAGRAADAAAIGHHRAAGADLGFVC
jgi:hypothetical protein